MTPFDSACGDAYRSDVLDNDKAGAIERLKQWLADNPSYVDEARAFVTANERIPHDRCFITSTRVGLLKAALA